MGMLIVHIQRKLLLLIKSYYSFDAGGLAGVVFEGIEMLGLKQKVENRIYYRKSLFLNLSSAYASWDSLLSMNLIFLWKPKSKCNCHIHVLRSQNIIFYILAKAWLGYIIIFKSKNTLFT